MPKPFALIEATVMWARQYDDRMPKLIVLYPPPSDVTTFERRYETEHAPMVTAKTLGVTPLRRRARARNSVRSRALSTGGRAVLRLDRIAAGGHGITRRAGGRGARHGNFDWEACRRAHRRRRYAGVGAIGLLR